MAVRRDGLHKKVLNASIVKLAHNFENSDNHLLMTYTKVSKHYFGSSPHKYKSPPTQS